MKVVNKAYHNPTPNDVYIGRNWMYNGQFAYRNGILGNPYTHRDLKFTRAQYQCESIESAVKNCGRYWKMCIDAGDQELIDALRDIPEDAILVCHCKDRYGNGWCHGDMVIAAREYLRKVGLMARNDVGIFNKHSLTSAQIEGFYNAVMHVKDKFVIFDSPYGKMKVRNLSFGALKWAASKKGYGYFPNDPELVNIPDVFTEFLGDNSSLYDVVLVNYYTPGATLGFHIDKDELVDVPIISASIGATAEFHWKHNWKDSATIEVLSSGDVISFGGEYRRIIHGVPVVHNDFDSRIRMRPGERLNFTFRSTGYPK